MPQPSNEAIVRPVTIKDAEAYAEMIVRSESSWPQSLLRGVPVTAAVVRGYMRSQDALGRFVAQVGDRIVGCSSLLRSFDEPNTAYVWFLNVEPDFQGRGIGKRLLRACVDRAVEEGVERVSLDTWGGNLKALPLYKKMGFFWVPETSVHMVNFIPTLLKHPLFREFFKDRDWYTTQVRDLSAKEDAMERDGIRVYCYRFEDGGEEVEAVFDAAGLWLTGGSNSNIEVWIHPKDGLTPDGVPFPFLWEIENKTSADMEVTIMVDLPSCAKLLDSPPRTVTLSPGKRFKFRGNLLVDPELVTRPLWEEPERIETLLIVNGQAMTFKTGLEAEDPVSCLFVPQVLMGKPGSSATASLKMVNHTKARLRGRIEVFSPGDPVRVSPTRVPFLMEPGGFWGGDLDGPDR